ncbi:MAG: hypothetical protein AB1394_17050, partial [Bacteroidota bacterium]
MQLIANYNCLNNKNILEVEMFGKSILKYLLAIIILTFQAGFAQPKIVSAKLAKSTITANAGSEVKVVLIAAIEKSWHINSNKP